MGANCYCRANPFRGALLVESEITILLGRRVHRTLPIHPSCPCWCQHACPPAFCHPSPSRPSLVAERRSRPADCGDLASDTLQLGPSQSLVASRGEGGTPSLFTWSPWRFHHNLSFHWFVHLARGRSCLFHFGIPGWLSRYCSLRLKRASSCSQLVRTAPTPYTFLAGSIRCIPSSYNPIAPTGSAYFGALGKYST
jgi:hypothetical protein